ncbi:MAG TPA: AraC family transcriptional regulator [Candidatus Binatia bacterium]
MRTPVRPVISTAATSGLVEAIRDAGADPDQLLHTVQLDPSVLSRTDKFIPCAMFARILEEAARITGDYCFGLHLGERFNPKNIGALTYVVLNSPTVAVGDDQVARYLKLYNQAATVSRSIEGERAYLRYVLCDLGIESPRQENEYSLAIRINTIRMMVGSQWTPLEVQFAHQAPAQISEHQRIFGAPVLFGYPTNNLVVEREFLERQVPAADPRLYEIMQRYFQEIIDAMPEDTDALLSVRKAIAESMRDGDPNLTRVAKKMALSRRTLQRQMKEHATNFKSVMDNTRRHFAVSYLKDRRNSVAEIAFLLGYSEAAAFTRAFKRWTGLTPLAYRHRATQLAADEKSGSANS